MTPQQQQAFDKLVEALNALRQSGITNGLRPVEWAGRTEIVIDGYVFRDGEFENADDKP